MTTYIHFEEKHINELDKYSMKEQAEFILELILS